MAGTTAADSVERVPDDVAAALAAALKARSSAEEASPASAVELATRCVRRLGFDGAPAVTPPAEARALAGDEQAVANLELTRVVLDNVVEGATRGAEARREAFSALAVALLVRRVTGWIAGARAESGLPEALRKLELEDANEHDEAREAGGGEGDEGGAGRPPPPPHEFAAESDDDDYDFQPLDGDVSAMHATVTEAAAAAAATTTAGTPDGTPLTDRLLVLLGAARAALAQAPPAVWPAEAAAADLQRLLEAAVGHPDAAEQLVPPSLAIARDRVMNAPRDTAALLPAAMAALPNDGTAATWLLAELARGASDGDGAAMLRRALWPQLREALPTAARSGASDGASAAEVVRAFAAFSAAGADVASPLLSSGAFKHAVLAAAKALAAAAGGAEGAAGAAAAARPALEAVWLPAAAAPRLAAWAAAVPTFKTAVAAAQGGVLGEGGALEAYGAIWPMLAARATGAARGAGAPSPSVRMEALVSRAADATRACTDVSDAVATVGAAEAAVVAASRAADALRLLATCCASEGGVPRKELYVLDGTLADAAAALRRALRDLPLDGDDAEDAAPAGGRDAAVVKLRELKPGLIAVLRELNDAGPGAAGAGKRE